MKKGELVYVPSKVKLFDNHPNAGTTRYKETQEPKQVLCLGPIENSENFLKILYEGQQWSVHKRDVIRVTDVS